MVEQVTSKFATVRILESARDASGYAAEEIIAKAGPGMRFGVATGSTPLWVYEYLREAHRQWRFTLSNATAWALDEYVGLPADHPEGYRNVLLKELVEGDATGLHAEQLHTPEGSSPDPEAAARNYDAALAGGADLQILGLGSNGHIGFNEPEGSFESRTRVEQLTPQTRNDNARFFGDDVSAVPERCITQGIANIMSAGHIVLLAFGEQKAEAVVALLEGPQTAEWPATVLHDHPSVSVYLDAAAASLLSTDYGRS